MECSVKNTPIQKKVLLLLIIISLIYTNFFACSFIDGKMTRYMQFIVIGVMLFILMIKKDRLNNSNFHFKKAILAFMIIPILSSFPCYFFHAQSIPASVMTVFPGNIWLLYFILHLYKVNEKTLASFFLIMSLAILFIQVFQQLSPEKAIFGLQFDETGAEYVEIRNGLYRFRVGSNAIFTMPILFLLWHNFCKSMSLKSLLIPLLLLTSIYLMLTRQLIAISLISLVLSYFFWVKKNKRIYGLFFLFILSMIIASYFDVLFGDLLEASSDNINNDDYIRYASANYFFEQSITNPMILLFGNGIPSGGTAYDSLINSLMNKGFFRTDVGFIGAAYNYGYIYLFIYFVLVLKLTVNKKIPGSYRLFFISTCLISLMIFPLARMESCLVWAILLYICDLHINKSNLVALENSK